MTGNRIDNFLKLFCISKVGPVSCEPSWQSWLIFCMSLLGSILLASSGVFFQTNNMRRSEIICFSMSCAGVGLAVVTFVAIIIGCITRRRHRTLLRHTRVSVRNTRRPISLESISIDFNKEALTTPTEAENDRQWVNTAFDYEYNDLLLYTRNGRRNENQDCEDPSLQTYKTNFEKNEKNHQLYETNLQRNENSHQLFEANLQRNENNQPYRSRLQGNENNQLYDNDINLQNKNESNQRYETNLYRHKIHHQPYDHHLRSFESQCQSYETNLKHNKINLQSNEIHLKLYQSHLQQYETDHQPYETDFDDIDSNSFVSSSETRTCSYNSCCSEDEGYFQTLSSSKESDLSDCYFENKRYCRWIPEKEVATSLTIDSKTGNSLPFYESKLDPQQVYLHRKMTSQISNMLNCRQLNSSDFENEITPDLNSVMNHRKFHLEEENLFQPNSVASMSAVVKPSTSGSQQSDLVYNDPNVNLTLGDVKFEEINSEDESRRYLEQPINFLPLKSRTEFKKANPTLSPDNELTIRQNDFQSSFEHHEYYLQSQLHTENQKVREKLNPEDTQSAKLNEDSKSTIDISKNVSNFLKYYDDHANLESYGRNIKPEIKNKKSRSSSQKMMIPQPAMMNDIDNQLPKNMVKRNYSSDSSGLSNHVQDGRTQCKTDSSEGSISLSERTCKLSEGNKHVKKQRSSKYMDGIALRIKKRPLLDANGIPISQAALVKTLTELFQNGRYNLPA